MYRLLFLRGNDYCTFAGIKESSKLLMETYSLKLSRKGDLISIVITKFNSLMNNKNQGGLRLDPCGTVDEM